MRFKLPALVIVAAGLAFAGQALADQTTVAERPDPDAKKASAPIAGERLCHSDPLLSAAASKLAKEGKPPAAERLVAEVRAAGSDAVSVRALWLPGKEQREKLARWMEEFREKADAPVHCGQADSPAGRLVIATARGGALERVDAKSLTVRGWVARGFDSPEIVVSDGAGQIRRYRTNNSALRQGFRIEEEMQPPLHLQLVASGRDGPRPVAERRTGAGAGHTEGNQGGAAAEGSGKPDPSAAILAFRLNRLRKREGLYTVRANRLLDEVANKHARAVCESGRVAHELQPGLDPESRLLLAGVRARTVGETVARSSNALSAFDAMNRSPSHRMTLLDARFTDAGVGVAADKTGHSCAVVLLAAWPRYAGR